MAGALSSELGASRVFVGGSAVSGAWDRDAAGLFVEELFGRHHGEIYAYLIRMIRDPELAADLTQDAFVKAYRNLDSFRLESSFYTWLYRIAMNLAIDFVRKRRRRETGGFDEGIATRDDDGGIAEVHHEDGPSRQLERKQLFGKIMDAMEQLPEDQRQVILLRELEGLQYKEIADVMGIPEGTVMSRLFYARKKLQKLLSGDPEAETK
jgi:RNA polymerase sigma-70 factor (ECF subfamily)